MVCGGLADRQLQLGEQLVVGGDQRQVDLKTFWHGGIRKALGDSLPVRFVGDLLAELRQVVLAVDVVDMGSECSAFAHQMCTAS